jgi:hypothetical protein
MFFDDVENLTVDELLAKQIELKRKMLQASASGMSVAIIAQMQGMLDNINIELQSKIAKEALIKDNTDDIDPDSEVLNIGTIEQ